MRLILPVFALLAACSTTVSPEIAAKRCEERARAAQGPTGNLTVGANSQSGPFTRASIGVTTDFLRGSDPDTVYDECFLRQTGELPISRPVLRN